LLVSSIERVSKLMMRIKERRVVDRFLLWGRLINIFFSDKKYQRSRPKRKKEAFQKAW